MIISDIGMMKKQTQTLKFTMFLFFVLYHLIPSGKDSEIRHGICLGF